MKQCQELGIVHRPQIRKHLIEIAQYSFMVGLSLNKQRGGMVSNRLAPFFVWQQLIMPSLAL